VSEGLLLVTNDDGVEAPGLRALARALGELGEVYVVAPDGEASASSQSLSLRRPLRKKRVEPQIHAVEGTPADCVSVAVFELLPRRPDLVVSGINAGANLAEDIFYSGTVGGAREATFLGVPAMAVSLATRLAFDFEPAAAFSARIAALVLERGLPPRTLLNVNVPPGRPTAAVMTVQGHREPQGGGAGRIDPGGYWSERSADWLQRDEISDIHAVTQGLVSITPLHSDTTHHDALASFREWEGVLRNGWGRR
jgi:5'-nucleotidase